MTAGNATNDFDDELLSAYVDGELTAAERALVEERLRSDPTAAALVEEMRLLSSAIRALPRETLGRDMRASVLAEVDDARTDLATHGPSTMPLPPVDRRAGFRRGLVWSALAIAATVLVAVFQPAEQERDASDVARAKKLEAAGNAPVVAESRQFEAKGTLDEEPASGAADELHEELRQQLPPGLRGSMGVGAGGEASIADLSAEIPATASQPAPAPMAPAPSETIIAQQGIAADESIDQFDAQSAGEESRPVIQNLEKADAMRYSANGQTEDRLALDSEAVKLKETPALPSVATRPLQATASSEAGALVMGRARGGRLEASQFGSELNFNAGDVPATVTLQLATAEGAARFKQLLAESDITYKDQASLKDGAVEFGERGQQLADGPSTDESGDKVLESLERPADSQFYAKSAPPTLLAGDAKRFAFARQAEEAVLVEATPAQIATLLEKCRAEKETFTVVNDAERTQSLAMAEHEEFSRGVAAGLGGAAGAGQAWAMQAPLAVNDAETSAGLDSLNKAAQAAPSVESLADAPAAGAALASAPTPAAAPAPLSTAESASTAAAKPKADTARGAYDADEFAANGPQAVAGDEGRVRVWFMLQPPVNAELAAPVAPSAPTEASGVDTAPAAAPADVK